MRDRTEPPAHNTPNRDIRELAFQVSSMQSQLRGFEQELQHIYNQQMKALEGLIKLSDYLMLKVNCIYDRQAGKNSTPEGQ